MADSPANLTVYDSTNRSISLQWDAPKYNGGHRISGYDVERQNLPSKGWVRCNVGNILATDFIVSWKYCSYSQFCSQF